jgi:hypothetical protein
MTHSKEPIKDESWQAPSRAPERSRSTGMREGADEHDAAFRLGALALAGVAGMVLGLIAACVAMALSDRVPSLGQFVFGMGLAGIAVGAVYPALAMDLVEMFLHFLIGFFSGSLEQVVEPAEHAPPYLKAALLFGTVAGLALAFLGWWY